MGRKMRGNRPLLHLLHREAFRKRAVVKTNSSCHLHESISFSLLSDCGRAGMRHAVILSRNLSLVLRLVAGFGCGSAPCCQTTIGQNAYQPSHCVSPSSLSCFPTHGFHTPLTLCNLLDRTHLSHLTFRE